MNPDSKTFQCSKIAKYLTTVLKDPDRKNIPTIMKEFVALSIRGRGPANHYFSSLLYKKVISNPADYLSSYEMHHSQEVLCDRSMVDIVGNKVLFQEFFEKRKLPLPRLIAYNFGRKLYFVQGNNTLEVRELDSVNALREAFTLLFTMSDTESVFVKLINGSLGLEARKMSRKAALTDSALSEMLKDLSSHNFLFQEEVVQHPDVCRLYSKCLNTIRIDTFKQMNGQAEVVSALIRIGMGETIVDNIAAGGIFVGIDLDSGCLKEHGFRNLNGGGAVYLAHPNTKTVFNGFRLPFFSEVKRLAMEAANFLPAGLMGWDIALTPEGPILIEGNAVYYSMELSDIAYGGYKRNPVFQKAFQLAMKQH